VATSRRRFLALLPVLIMGLIVVPALGSSQGSNEEQCTAARHLMVEQIRSRGVSDPAVLAALEAVPRHRFVAADRQGEAYADHPLPIGDGQTISQPYMVALMTSLLELRPGARVLEIGTGSGYQAAVLSQVAEEVYTIEILTPLADRSRHLLADLGFRNVQVRTGDGFKGWPEAAPFDGILVTAAPPSIPEPLLRQLKVGSRLVIPVGVPGAIQNLLVLTKRPDGGFDRSNVMPVRFVPMTGEAQRER
jgi:protein-L-isoaspartate(D-aspartate) O-methyltransferase